MHGGKEKMSEEISLKDCHKVTLEELEEIAADARGIVNKVYAHWTAGHYGQAFNSYHILIDEKGNAYITTEDFTEKLAHTWRRNSQAIGVSMMCAYKAEARNGRNCWLGYEPPTSIQITALSQVAAVLSKALGIPLDKEHFMTHCEAAILDGYGVPHGEVVNGVYQGDPDLRWDLWYLPDPNNNGVMTDGGQLWRGMANWYKNEWEKEE